MRKTIKKLLEKNHKIRTSGDIRDGYLVTLPSLKSFKSLDYDDVPALISPHNVGVLQNLDLNVDLNEFKNIY